MTDGILLVDKPRGPTSHDVVARMRRILRTKAVGHAGTLDPMATGLLVLGIGEGTKLLAAYEDHDKRYEARVGLGRATDTLDADGTVIATADVPALEHGDVDRAASAFRGRFDQRVPAYSAVKRGGVALHQLARRGLDVELPVRSVEVHDLTVRALDADEIALAVHASKGFYVRSLARDLGERLGTLGHLVSLRRVASGPFHVDAAQSLDALVRGEPPQLLPLSSATGRLPRIVFAGAAAAHARHGRPVPFSDLDDTTRLAVEALGPGARLAILLGSGELLALASRGEDAIRIDRGFVEGHRAFDAAPRTEVPCIA